MKVRLLNNMNICFWKFQANGTDRPDLCNLADGGAWNRETVSASSSRCVQKTHMVFTGSTQPEDFILKLNKTNSDGLFNRFFISTPLSHYDIPEAISTDGKQVHAHLALTLRMNVTVALIAVWYYYM